MISWSVGGWKMQGVRRGRGGKESFTLEEKKRKDNYLVQMGEGGGMRLVGELQKLHTK